MNTNIIYILKAILLGIVEGITEFLPISSTGHMIIVGHFIRFEGDFAKLFEIVIQLGAILAIIVLFWRRIINSFRNLKPKREGFNLWLNVIIAFIPSGIIALLFHDKVEELLMKPVPVATSLLVGGIWMIYAENKYRKNYRTARMEQIDRRQAFTIGIFQCLSILWPGFSRSASTIIGGWIMGLSTPAAADFSFFLAIPTMLAATLYSLLKTKLVLSGLEIAALVIGFVVAFIVALVVVDRFISFLKHRKMRIFAVYRIVISVIILSMAAFKIL